MRTWCRLFMSLPPARFKTCSISVERVATSSIFNSLYLKKELPGDTYAKIMEIRRTNVFPDESDYIILDHQHEKSIRNIHMALDSDDVDLVGMLLKESAVTLDDAFAVHYAATFCTPKVVSELLKVDSADVNLKNNGGYTLLHMACLTLEPGIILSLIEKGASVQEWTQDGRDALTICKRLTKEKDFHRKLEKVAFAGIFFPSEAKLAMCTAEADSTEEFTGATLSKLKEVGLSEIPTMQNRRLPERLDALSKTGGVSSY